MGWQNQHLNLLAGGSINISVFVKLSTAADNTCLQASVAKERVIGISQVGTKRPPNLPGTVANLAAETGDAIEIFGIGDVCLLLAGAAPFTRGDWITTDATAAGTPAVAAGGVQYIGAIGAEVTPAAQYGRVQVMLCFTTL